MKAEQVDQALHQKFVSNHWKAARAPSLSPRSPDVTMLDSIAPLDAAIAPL